MSASPQHDAGPPVRGPVDDDVVAARYGRGPSAATRRRRLVAAVVAAALLLAAAVALQAASLREPSVEVENLGFTVEDASSTTVRFSLLTAPGTTATCTLVALNESFTQVGFRQVTVGPVTAERTSHKAVVTTTELATTGSVESCRVVDRG